MFKFLNTKNVNRVIFITLGVIIIVVLVIVLTGGFLTWKYNPQNLFSKISVEYRFNELVKKTITPLSGSEISFSDDCDELSEQLGGLTKQANYCDDDLECFFVEHDICSPGSFILVNRGADLTKLYEGMEKFRTSCSVCDWASLIQEQKGGIKCSNHICVIKMSTSEINCIKLAESFASNFPDFFESVEEATKWCNGCVNNNGRPYLRLSTGPFCNLKTLDAGKICTDYNQCKGDCIGKDKNSISGLCSDVETIIGCVFQMQDGEAIEVCYD